MTFFNVFCYERTMNVNLRLAISHKRENLFFCLAKSFKNYLYLTEENRTIRAFNFVSVLLCPMFITRTCKCLFFFFVYQKYFFFLFLLEFTATEEENQYKMVHLKSQFHIRKASNLVYTPRYWKNGQKTII